MVDQSKIRDLAKEGKKERPPQGDHTGEPPAIESLLNAKDLEDLREMARDKVVQEYKDSARKVVLQRMVEEERSKLDPEEEMLDCLIDLPGHSAVIKINMKPYWHGVTYTVPISIFRTLIDIMALAWKHEEVVNNVNRSRYQPVSKRQSLNARTQQVTTANVLHA